MTEADKTVQDKKVMIIDDDEINNFLCKKIIQVSGMAKDVYSFLSAQKGLEFLNLNKNEKPEDLPDLIFLDINMPVMNGWDFLDEFRQIGIDSIKEIPVVILSSSVYQMDIDKSKNYSEVKEFVSKPLSNETLNNLWAKYF